MTFSHVVLCCAACLLFTGVGKTELAKALASFLFNTEEAMVGCVAAAAAAAAAVGGGAAAAAAGAAACMCMCV